MSTPNIRYPPASFQLPTTDYQLGFNAGVRSQRARLLFNEMKYKAQIQELKEEVSRYKKGWRSFTYCLGWNASSDSVEKGIRELKGRFCGVVETLRRSEEFEDRRRTQT
jgi:hypothetical protein